MSASKLKNIIILVLVVMDLFLAALVIPRVISAAGTDGAATRQIEQLLLENGISAGQGVIPNSGAGTRGVEFRRSADAEQRAAEILLGSNAEKKDMGGGIVSYESGRGEVTFRASGEIYAVLSEPPSGNFAHPENALRLMEKMGVSAESITRGAVDGKIYISVAQSIRGVEVRGTALTLVYGVGGLEEISGRWYQDGSLNYVTTDRLAPATALLDFINSRDQLGYVCAAITEMRVVYTPVSGSDNLLSPSWLIVTDTGAFLVDFSTRQVTQE